MTSLTARLRPLALGALFCLPLLTAPTAAEDAVQAAANSQRIITAGAGLTELVAQLGALDQLVAVDVSSSWPAEVKQLPQIGYHRALSSEGLLSLEPTLILGSDEMGPPPIFGQLKEAGVAVVRMDSDPSEASMLARLNRVAALLGRETEASNVWNRYLEQRDQLKAATDAIEQPRRVLFLVTPAGNSPLIAGRNTPADKLIQLAGAENVASELIDGYKPLSAEAILAANPEVILVPASISRMLGSAQALIQSQPGLDRTPAGRNRAITEIDGGVLVAGVTPRIIEVAKALNRALYP